MPRADRAAIRGAPVGLIDPDGRLRQVLRSDKPGSRDPARTAQERDRENQPFEPLDGTQHTAPVDSDLRLDEMGLDRKSTRLNSSHTVISYAVFCLKKKKKYSKTQ